MFNPVNTKFQDFEAFYNDSFVTKNFLANLYKNLASKKIILKSAKAIPVLPHVPFEELYPTLVASNIVALGIPYKDIEYTYVFIESNADTMRKVEKLEKPYQFMLIESMSTGPIEFSLVQNDNLDTDELKVVMIYITSSPDIKNV